MHLIQCRFKSQDHGKATTKVQCCPHAGVSRPELKSLHLPMLPRPTHQVRVTKKYHVFHFNVKLKHLILALPRKTVFKVLAKTDCFLYWFYNLTSGKLLLFSGGSCNNSHLELSSKDEMSHATCPSSPPVFTIQGRVAWTTSTSPIASNGSSERHPPSSVSNCANITHSKDLSNLKIASIILKR